MSAREHARRHVSCSFQPEIVGEWAERSCRQLARQASRLARDGLPAGTVTFLFTDVEGSTRLLEQLGAGPYADALAEHRRALRAAFEARGGVEVDTQGDAFFFVFETARDGLEAARAGQEALVEGPIRVRMAVHTGAPLLAEEGYVGVDVHRAARIAAAGHGGQVLVLLRRLRWSSARSFAISGSTVSRIWLPRSVCTSWGRVTFHR